ncbi:redoxin domain-containing protein [Candidatus Saccharibacteria bacterium]|nr:redoxin domain-containing protein [Candidatus Saccharibacteria bacterium]
MKFKLALLAVITVFGGAFIFVANKSGDKTITNMSPADKLANMIGKPAPDFSLPSHNGQTFNLAQQRGKKVVLFFNEGIMCYPACWNQMASLGSDGRLNNDKVVSASIVADTKDQWVEAVKKMPELGQGTLLLDTDMAVSRQYGMLLLESSMHRGSKPGHTYVIVDEEGIVQYTSDDPQMGIRNDAIVAELSKI